MPIEEENPRSLVLPVCASCIHDAGDRCKAYPEGIPYRLLAGLQHHTSIELDQMGGTVFEQDPALPAPDASVWEQAEEEEPAE